MYGASGLDERTPAVAVRAFTLTEMVIVLVIMGILTSIAVPRFSGAMSRRGLQAAERRLRADLDMAASRARALSASQTVSFSVAPAPSQYVIMGLVDPDEGAAYVVDLEGEPYAVNIAAADFEGDTTLVINGHGMALQSGEVVLEAGGQQVKVTVQAPVSIADE